MTHSERGGADVESRAVPILTYHSLDDTGSVISTPPSVFRRQMESLHARGFGAIRLPDLLEAWSTGGPLPARPIVLTFDDGFRNLLEHAAPVLTDLGFGATVFAVAGHCGGRNDWPGQPRGLPLLPLLSWPELRSLAGEGFEVGSHGLRHLPLDRLSGPEAEDEIAGSKQRLEDGLGRAVRVFAYPFGLADPAARRMVARHYRGGCCVELGVAREHEDPHWLPRIEMFYLRSPSLFRLFGTPLGSAYLGLRRLARAGREVARRVQRPKVVAID